MKTLTPLLTALALFGCSATIDASHASPGADSSTPTDSLPTTDTSPPTCTSRRDCRPDEDCIGPPGCAIPWTCQPAPGACTHDLVQYCGCSGATISGSSTCPPGPYASRGPCADAGS